MAALKSLSAVSATNSASKKSNGEIALARISSEWKGSGLTAAKNAAFEVGKLVAGGMLAHHKGDEFWKRRFKAQLVDEKWWSTVHEAFQSGRSSLVTMNDLIEQYCSVPANDNAKDDSINAETRLAESSLSLMASQSMQMTRRCSRARPVI